MALNASKCNHLMRLCFKGLFTSKYRWNWLYWEAIDSVVGV